MQVPRILVVDDHQLAREGLAAVLSKAGFEVVGDAASGEEAIELAKRLVPDVVLMDVRLGPGIDGLEATRRVLALGLPIRVLMLTLHDMPSYVREAVAAGATGYVLKEAAIDDLRAAINQVFIGQTAIPIALLSGALQDDVETAPNVEAIASLTQRELSVLDLVTRGMTNKEIARRLAISPSTVKVHVERIIAKLGVADRTQAAVVATEGRAGAMLA